MYKSKNINLRAFTEDDAKFIVEMRKDFEGVKAAGGRPYPVNENNETEWISNMYPNSYLTNIHFVIEETETKLFIGYCSALNINYINRNAHVGLFFHENGRGKRYFKEAQMLFYAYLFNEINLRKVYSYALAYNEIAIKVDTQIGFKVDGIMKEHIYQGGKYHDALMLSLTAKDFFNNYDLKDFLI
jgi:RimJ/RimL family protein N-acetyltransferase